MSDTRIYFGTPGSLITLHHPRGGVEPTRAVPVQEFPLGNGEYRTRRAASGSRLFSLDWANLSYDDFSTLAAYAHGHNGPGPFVFLNPGERNHLTVNQASATSDNNEASDFTVAGTGQTIASSTTLVRRGPRSLAWTFASGSPPSGSVTLDTPYVGWYGIPVALRPQVFSFYARGGGTDGIVTLTPQIVWYNTAGGVVATTSGSSAATATGAWTAFTATATAPAGTAYALPRVTYTSGASAGSIVYLDNFQFEEGSTPGTWRPGTGVFPVTIVSLDEKWPWLSADELREGPKLVLREDGR